MDKRHCPSHANRSAVRALGAALEGRSFTGGPELICAMERPLE